MREFGEFAKKHGGLLVLTELAALLTFGLLVFCGNIRIDTEELLNEPGTTLGWLSIGRYGLVLLKRMLGLSAHNRIWSGVLFFVFFCLGANLLLFFFFHFAGENAHYPYVVFLLLYVTSNIWCFQIYFSLQQAEIALAMLLVIVSAAFTVEACFVRRGKGRLPFLLGTLVLLVVAFGSYQALVAFYVAVCAALFLLYVEHRWQEQMRARRIFEGIGTLLVHFLAAYGIYCFIANRWFMSSGEYMTSQRGWGRLPAAECVKNILRSMKGVLLMRGPENFSYYTIGMLLALAVLILGRRGAKREAGGSRICKNREDKTAAGLRAALWLLALAALLYSPFLMVTYSGEMVVVRTQFALPAAAAFLGMYGIGKLQSCPGAKKLAAAGAVLAVFVTAGQVGYTYRLAYTDNIRYAQDAARSETVLAQLREVCGGEPEVPVVFVGSVSPELPRGCIRTEMYGWSFYEWDCNETNPTGATHRISGFIEAYSGVRLNQDASAEQRRQAVKLAQGMRDFPEQGSVQVTKDMIVVKLSEAPGQEPEAAEPGKAIEEDKDE